MQWPFLDILSIYWAAALFTGVTLFYSARKCYASLQQRYRSAASANPNDGKCWNGPDPAKFFYRGAHLHPPKVKIPFKPEDYGSVDEFNDATNEYLKLMDKYVTWVYHPVNADADFMARPKNVAERTRNPVLPILYRQFTKHGPQVVAVGWWTENDLPESVNNPM